MPDIDLSTLKRSGLIEPLSSGHEISLRQRDLVTFIFELS